MPRRNRYWWPEWDLPEDPGRRREPDADPRAPGVPPPAPPKLPPLASYPGDGAERIARLLDEIAEAIGQPPFQPPPPNDPPPPKEPPWPHDGGTDSCAWYLSFRYGSEFGIYMCRNCIRRIATYLVGNGVQPNTAVRATFMFLYGHELLHYRVDRAVESLEGITHLLTGRRTSIWLLRFTSHQPDSAGRALVLLEEAIANAIGLKSATSYVEDTSTSPTSDQALRVSESLKTLMRASGDGYRHFEDAMSPRTTRRKGELVSLYAQLLQGRSRPSGTAVDELHSLIPSAKRSTQLRIDPTIPLFIRNC